MQDYQVTFYQSHQKQEISQRTQNLLSSLKDMWKQLRELSHENVMGILEMADCFSEPYHTTILHSIAEKLMSSMTVHYLDILATFIQNAEQEGIDREEQTATVADTMVDLFPILTGLNSRLPVRTLDELITLAAITVGLYGLSHTETAEEAQHWLYALPQEYARQLTQEHLIVTPSLQFTVAVHAITIPIMPGLSNVKVSFAAPGTMRFVLQPPQIAISSASEMVQHIDSTATESQKAIAA